MRKKDCNRTELLAGALLVLLALAPAAKAASLRLDAGGAYEDYSFAAAGGTQWASGSLALDERRTLLAAQTLVRRFGVTQGQGALGGAYKLTPRSALEARVELSPEETLLPGVAIRALLYQGLGGGWTITPGATHARYATARVDTASLGADWESRAVTLTARVYGTNTTFRTGGGSRLTPGLLTLGKFPLGGGFFLVPSYGYREESFQAGAPGAYAAAVFTARTMGTALHYELRPGLSARASWSYEDRLPKSYMRQYELWLSYRPGSR